MVRRLLALVAVAAVLGSGACSSDDPEPGAATTTGVATLPTDPEASETTDPDDATTSSTGSSAPAETTTTSAEAGDAGLKEGAADGAGTAQLVAVRIGRQEGADRVVLEFAEEIRPGWRIEWVDGPITEDGSGNPVSVEGPAFLQILVQPATGYDFEAAAPTYDGPARLAGPGGGAVNEVVRTGDFEALLTWAVGADAETPFTVSTLDSPSRLVIDIRDA